MNQLLTFLHPVLRSLDDGNPIRTVASRVLQAIAVTTLLVGVLAVIQVLKVSFGLSSTPATLGGLLFAAILVAAILAAAQTMLYRAQTVVKLGRSAFTVIPIVSVFFRLVGEVYAIFGLSVAVGSCVFTWLAGDSESLRNLTGGFGALIPMPSTGGTFLAGLVLFAVGSAASFLVLILSYFLAESSLVLVDIARNIQWLRVHPSATPTATGGQTATLTCPNCGTPNPGSAKGEFCSECGTRL